MRPTGQRHRTYQLLIGVLGVALVLTSAAACGSDAGSREEGAFQKVTPSERIYTFDDFVAAGFRKSKEYDVEGLTAATGAWFGWWRLGDGDPVDYEVRFYRSHEDAVEYGTSFAEEASGDDAIITSREATWEEDVRERRSIIGVTESGGVGSGGGFGMGPKYPDYAIFANMVLLCEGAVPDHSLERCEALMEAVMAAAEE